MTEALDVLEKSAKDTAVETVQHKYGHDAGQFVGDSLDIASNAYALKKVGKMGVKGALKKGGKEAALGLG